MSFLFSYEGELFEVFVILHDPHAHIMLLSLLWALGFSIPNKSIQGISYWNLFYELTLTDRNMQARFYLKVLLKSWGSDIRVSSTSFQKSNIGWPQQPPTEIGPKIWRDISWFYHFFSSQNIKIKLSSRTCIEVLNITNSDI